MRATPCILFIQYINRYVYRSHIYIIFRAFQNLLVSNKVAAYFLSTTISSWRPYCTAIFHDRDISRFKLPVINSKRGYDGGGGKRRKGGYQ